MSLIVVFTENLEKCIKKLDELRVTLNDDKGLIMQAMSEELGTLFQSTPENLNWIEQF